MIWNPWAIGGLFGLGLATGWLVNGWRLSGELEAIQKAHAMEIARAVTSAQNAERKAQESLRNDLEAIEHDKQTAFERVDYLLRNPVTVRVPVKSTCLPASGSAAASDEAAAELTEPARQDYLDLRKQIAETRSICESAQSVIRACVKSGGCR